MSFRSYREVIESIGEGKESLFSFRKAPSQTTTANTWFDFSMFPGNPLPNYYASSPLTSATLGTDGIQHGGDVENGFKFIKELMIISNSATGLPLVLNLCDYLLYYPFVDMGTTDSQTFTNSLSLPRWTDGKGVRAMAVQLFPQIGGQSFSFTYTNSNGVAGRVSPTISFNTNTSTGCIITSGPAQAGIGGPYLPLMSGDTGIQSIQSLTMNGIDIGSFAIVLVKPLATIRLREQTAPCEIDYFKDFLSMPKIFNGAYLNFIGSGNGNLSATQIHGTLKTIWS